MLTSLASRAKMEVEACAVCWSPAGMASSSRVLNAVTGYHLLQPPSSAPQVTRHSEIVTNSTGELTQHIVVLVQQR